MRWPAFLLLMVLLASALHGQESRADAQSNAVNQPAIPAKQEQFFARQIRPFLVEHGIECHGADTQENGLRLDSRDAVLRGGERGPTVELPQAGVNQGKMVVTTIIEALPCGWPVGV